MVTSSTARTTATIAWLSAMLVGHGALAQTDPVPYDCCTDRECLVCPDTAFTLDECGANGHEYGFDINDARGGNFVCEPTGTTPTCCETTAVDPCDPNPGDTCYSFEQFCWETLFGVPCLNDPTSCCTVGGPIPLPFDVMCAADPIWSPPQFCPMRVFAGPPNLQILDATVLEPGVGQLVQLVYDVVLDSDPMEPFTVDVQTTAGGTATELADYLPFISTLSFVPGGPLLQTFQVTVIGDTLVEGDETVEVSISSVQPASAVVVTKGTAIGTILDDDAPATPMFSILDAAPVMEGAGPMEFTITLSSDPPIPVTVDVLGTPVGTADLGLDFNFPVTTLTFLPGGPLSQTVQVTIINDVLLEGDETVVLALGREEPLGLVGVTRRTASGIITDNDATNLPPSITFPTPGQSIQIPETDVLFIDVQSTDDNDSEGSGLVYSLLPAPDTHLFIIDATTGVIGFVGGITPPFTNPLDADANGVYELAVTVQDSGGLESVPVLFQVTVVDAGPTDVGPTDPTDVNPTDPTNVGPTGFNGGVQGDPHFLTWNGKMYDYMGACDLVLLHAPNFKDNNTALDIHIRTKTRYDYSYIETAAVQIGEDILER
ncbi:Glycoside hydrolase Family 5 [Seminavis robusta]|uniref:Glycoside hydrolase Family 5 n=1 Tax=Seminavis robusta TaxID=568900 RepID=A0A9N8E1B1_9STRA|nr:Glycoside hydrolase Family 5 [Seminavis robusta]|eukprot:Sro551_g164870.1 Glycoside hydrolase Family 5 (602) ;mRNA; r:26723-28718